MSAVNIVFDLLKKHGAKDYIGENITQLQHMIASAMYSQQMKYDNDVVVAALFHDIGHLLAFEEDVKVDLMVNEKGEPLGVQNHEEVGALYLEKLGFSSNVCDLVRNHVKAKRYLVSSNIQYRNNLSEASRQTLEVQGGKLLDEEISTFEKHPLFNKFLQLRYADENGKRLDHTYMELESFRELCQSQLVK